MKKNIILSTIFFLCISQVTFAAGKAASSNSKAASVYIIKTGVVKRAPSCELIDPVIVYERLTQIKDTQYICYTDDGAEYVTHVARAGDNSVEIEINLEDNFDGT